MTARIILPSGIGDVLFAYLKLHALSAAIGEPVEILSVGEGHRRSDGFTRLLPNVQPGGYTDEFTYLDIDRAASVTAIRKLRGRTTLLQANRHLEAGARIEEWLDELPAKFSVDWQTTDAHKARAAEIASSVVTNPGCPTLLIYPAAYGPARSWGFWLDDKWAEFVTALHAATGCAVILVGATFDMDMVSPLSYALIRSEASWAKCVGEDFGVVVELMKLVDGLIAFPSGIPIVASIVGLPTVWWMPDHLNKLPSAFLPPGAEESGRIQTRAFECVQSGIAGVLESPTLALAIASARARVSGSSVTA